MNWKRKPGKAARMPSTEWASKQTNVLCGNSRAFEEANATVSESPGSSSVSSSVPEGPADAVNSMQLRGQHWFVSYRGCSEFTVPNSVGMRYITAMLEMPEQPVSAWILKHLVASNQDAPAPCSRDTLVDVSALREYHRRAQHLKDEIRIAELNHDDAAKSRHQEEQLQLHQEISRVTGLSGKIRDYSADEEKARKAVLAAIQRARRTVSMHHPHLGRHLELISTGYEIEYRPEHEIVWNISTQV